MSRSKHRAVASRMEPGRFDSLWYGRCTACRARSDDNLTAQEAFDWALAHEAEFEQ